jgi:hypothetical protein
MRRREFGGGTGPESQQRQAARLAEHWNQLRHDLHAIRARHRAAALTLRLRVDQLKNLDRKETT